MGYTSDVSVSLISLHAAEKKLTRSAASGSSQGRRWGGEYGRELVDSARSALDVLAVANVLGPVAAELIVTLTKPLLPPPSPGYDERGLPVPEGTDALPPVGLKYTPGGPLVRLGMLLVTAPTEALLSLLTPEDDVGPSTSEEAAAGSLIEEYTAGEPVVTLYVPFVATRDKPLLSLLTPGPVRERTDAVPMIDG